MKFVKIVYYMDRQPETYVFSAADVAANIDRFKNLEPDITLYDITDDDMIVSNMSIEQEWSGRRSPAPVDMSVEDRISGGFLFAKGETLSVGDDLTFDDARAAVLRFIS